jgi:hypothetical protein
MTETTFPNTLGCPNEGISDTILFPTMMGCSRNANTGNYSPTRWDDHHDMMELELQLEETEQLALWITEEIQDYVLDLQREEDEELLNYEKDSSFPSELPSNECLFAHMDDDGHYHSDVEEAK